RSKHSNLEGKVWDACKGQLKDNWLLQSGTIETENNFKNVFRNLVNSATKSIDILHLGSLSGDFNEALKAFIKGYTNQLTIRIFSGIAPEIDVSVSFEGANIVRKALIHTGIFVEKAFGIYKDLLDNVNSVPSNINLFVGAGDVPTGILPT